MNPTSTWRFQISPKLSEEGAVQLDWKLQSELASLFVKVEADAFFFKGCSSIGGLAFFAGVRFRNFNKEPDFGSGFLWVFICDFKAPAFPHRLPHCRHWNAFVDIKVAKWRYHKNERLTSSHTCMDGNETYFHLFLKAKEKYSKLIVATKFVITISKKSCRNTIQVPMHSAQYKTKQEILHSRDRTQRAIVHQVIYTQKSMFAC